MQEQEVQRISVLHVDLLHIQRGTRKKKNLQTRSLMITDEILMKVVNFTNAKISAFISYMKDKLNKTDKKTHFRLASQL